MSEDRPRAPATRNPPPPDCDGTDDTALKIYLYSRAQSVMGGTSQIQRNLVAQRILGLPT